MKTLRPLFGRETPGMDLSAAAVTREMDATTAAWDALLSTLTDQGDQGDHAAPRGGAPHCTGGAPEHRPVLRQHRHLADRVGAGPPARPARGARW
jgi:hypothetical protein